MADVQQAQFELKKKKYHIDPNIRHYPLAVAPTFRKTKQKYRYINVLQLLKCKCP